MPTFLNTQDADFAASFEAVLNAKREDSPDVDAVVADIIADVRARGDAALVELTAKFDRFDLAKTGLAFTAEEVDRYCAEVPDAETFDRQIVKFHRPHHAAVFQSQCYGEKQYGVNDPAFPVRHRPYPNSSLQSFKVPDFPP